MSFGNRYLTERTREQVLGALGERGVKMNTVSEKRLNKLEHKLDIQGRCQV